MSRKQELESKPAELTREVDFFQLVRKIERETALRVGQDLPPDQEPIVFRANPDSQFPATQVAHWDTTTDPPTVTVSCFGLFGPSGALPAHYTDIINERARSRDFAFRDFLDLFNHRLLSFFYRSWEKNRFPVAYETAKANDAEDQLTLALRGLIGMLTPGLWDRLHVESSDFLFFAGHLANRRPTSSGLRNILESALGLPIQIEQFVGQWMEIPPSEQTRLGDHPLGISLGNQLGVEAISGSRIWDCENRFRVRVGPVTFEQFLELNPGGDQINRLFDYVRLYVGPQYDVDCIVIVRRDEVVTAQLGNSSCARLGWNTWLGEWNKDHDAEDAIFECVK
ncbi:MAG: type VI secretion system baseplate subunit TssG [Pirellula sp.]|jgi:type VI secretion system protein ImpH|nr:type VI secretion system baseplate subunit TssG [Pirellula sp.]